MAELEIPDLSELGVTGTMTGAGALALYWTFGPSIKAVGNAFGTWTEYRMNNLLRIGEKIDKRISSERADDGESVHPRAAKELIHEASWISDDIHQEYVAGLLVGSRSPDGSNDDGVYYARIISGLTSSQVRLHYAIYSAYEGTAVATSPKLRSGFNQPREARDHLTIRASKTSVHAVCGDHDSYGVGANGLIREGLIDDYGNHGEDDYVFVPSLLGAILYHHALGYPGSIDAIRFEREQLMRIVPKWEPVVIAPAPLALSDVKFGTDG
jgi:hypothetical protein